MTFSLVGRCDRTGQLGAVITSSSPAVAARCAFARARVGAACSQNVTDPTLGPGLLDALERGRSAGDALAEVVVAAPHVEYRQLSVVGADGPGAVWSGDRALGRAATATGPGCAAAGNLLADAGVPAAMVEAFLAAEGADLGDRLLAALVAGHDAGGEESPVRSAGLLVVDELPWPATDLRIDWCEADPIEELGRLWELWKPQAADYVTRALDPAAAPAFGVPGDA
ncbi:MAG TPA: DUF1028 domain-containing protein [Gaiellaceae bacterium]|nr:DUF1028 domain-containing protein [Gaiellaceae bacterium]